MLKSTFYRAIISRRAVKQANIVWSVPRTPPQPLDDAENKLAGIEFHENDDEDLASNNRFSKPLKGLVENIMSKDTDVKERLHKLEQKSYFKPEIVPLFDSEKEKGKIPKNYQIDFLETHFDPVSLALIELTFKNVIYLFCFPDMYFQSSFIQIYLQLISIKIISIRR